MGFVAGSCAPFFYLYLFALKNQGPNVEYIYILV